jgi:hypothetical protein
MAMANGGMDGGAPPGPEAPDLVGEAPKKAPIPSP